MKLQKAEINKHYCNYCDIVSVSPYKLNLHRDTTKHKNLLVFAESYKKLIDDIELIKYHNDNIKFIREFGIVNNANINKLSSKRIFLDLSNNLKSCPTCNFEFNNKAQIIDHIVKCSQKQSNSDDIVRSLNKQDILRMYYLVDEYRKNIDKLNVKTVCTEQSNYQELNKTYLNLLEKYKINKTNLINFKKRYNGENKVMNEIRKQFETIQEKIISLREENAKLIAERDNAINNLNEFKRRYDTLDKEYKEFLTNQTNLTNKTDKSNNYSNCIGNQNNNIKNKSTYKLVINNYSNAKDLETKISTNNPDSYLKLTKIMIEDDPNAKIDTTKHACRGVDICVGSCELGKYCITKRPLENNILDICQTPSNIDKYFVDIILKLYKPINPIEQSIWSTDARRNNYLIKVSKDGESIWIVDKKGLKLIKIAILPLIRFYCTLMDKHNDYLLDNTLVVTKIMNKQIEYKEILFAKSNQTSTKTKTKINTTVAKNKISICNCEEFDNCNPVKKIENKDDDKVDSYESANELKLNGNSDKDDLNESYDETYQIEDNTIYNSSAYDDDSFTTYDASSSTENNPIKSSLTVNNKSFCPEGNVYETKESIDENKQTTYEGKNNIAGNDNYYTEVLNDPDNYDIMDHIKINDENINENISENDKFITINIADKVFKISKNKYGKLLGLEIDSLAAVNRAHTNNRIIIAKMLKRIKDKNYSNLIVNILSRHFRLTKDQATIKNE